MFALVTVAVSTFVEKVIVMAASTGTPVGAVAVLRSTVPATIVSIVRGTGSSSLQLNRKTLVPRSKPNKSLFIFIVQCIKC